MLQRQPMLQTSWRISSCSTSRDLAKDKAVIKLELTQVTRADSRVCFQSFKTVTRGQRTTVPEKRASYRQLAT
eukprot:6201879-Pleurochrysis_carterae.AAC.1